MALALHALSIDCGDADKLAAFWAAALGRPVDPGATPEKAGEYQDCVAPSLAPHQDWKDSSHAHD